MSLPVFFTDEVSSEIVSLSGPEGRHAVTVKRMQPGEKLILSDGRGQAVAAEITEVSGKDYLDARVIERIEVQSPSPRVIVVQALPKSERSELAVDLAVQAGADAIIPWQAQRCEAKWVGPKIAKHIGKWESAAKAAAKQSRRLVVPRIHQPVTSAQLAKLLEGETAYVLHEDASTSIREVSLDVQQLYIVVGPEGGIGQEELGLVGAQAVRLGPEVYRTASAAMVALTAIGALKRW